jgi:hypothetical protein
VWSGGLLLVLLASLQVAGPVAAGFLMLAIIFVCIFKTTGRSLKWYLGAGAAMSGLTLLMAIPFFYDGPQVIYIAITMAGPAATISFWWITRTK